jgi:DNA helicase II / ATP-dependent DNA helicase PcrA
MKLNDIFKATYPKGQAPNPEQLSAIKSVDGPLLMVAGPGSGKTKTLITRSLNLLIAKKVKPENILLCTFTEIAARQLRDRLNAGIKKCGADEIDIHEMTIGTIHSVCQKIIDEYPNEAGVGIWSKSRGLGRGYIVLDDLKRMFFMMDYFDEIFRTRKIGERYLGLWKGYWDTIKRSQELFDKITEQRVELSDLRNSGDQQLELIGKAMTAYRKLQIEHGKIDFSHLEWLALDLLLNNAGARKEFQNKFEYVMVDEYQDTNYIQEQLIFNLANKDRNIAVVGDVDQSIYRFRGATTQNILSFAERVGTPGLKPINLAINYRSSQQIIDLYQPYRDETNWRGFRYDLSVSADQNMEQKRPEYQALIKIDEDDALDEGDKVADLIVNLKKAGTIQDYNQVAILLHSVRSDHSQQYLNAILRLKDQGEEIEVYAPRARLFFERPEVMCALAGLHSINTVSLSDDAGGFPGAENESIRHYLNRCVQEFRSFKSEKGFDLFLDKIKELQSEINKTKNQDGKPKKKFIDYFYSVVNTEFMIRWMDEELPARHLAQVSNLIDVFTEYYSYEWVTKKNADKIWDKFFNSFLRVLFEGGLNEYEEEEQAFPSGAIQIMTFHQSKGLEFPVVIVGSLHAQISTGKKIDELIGDFYQREQFEPISRISEFDKRRLYYVAFSRAKDFLVLTGHNDLTERIAKRKDHFSSSLDFCQLWDETKAEASYKKVKCKKEDDELLKPIFGFTSHINAYERCPMQFKFQKLFGFVPSRNEQLWMGNVVHNTLKDIHDHVLKNKSGDITDSLVKDYLERNIESMARFGIRPQQTKDGSSLEDVAFNSILRYTKDNKDKLKHCRWAEKEILVDEKDYTLTGVIDLLIHDDTNHVELVDFKAGRKNSNKQFHEGYADQIRLYCKQAEKKIGKQPDEAYLYWITEPKDVDPKDPIDTDPSLLNKTKQRVDDIAQKIIKKEFPPRKKKDKDVCGICEFKARCT